MHVFYTAHIYARLTTNTCLFNAHIYIRVFIVKITRIHASLWSLHGMQSPYIQYEFWNKWTTMAVWHLSQLACNSFSRKESLVLWIKILVMQTCSLQCYTWTDPFYENLLHVVQPEYNKTVIRWSFNYLIYLYKFSLRHTDPLTWNSIDLNKKTNFAEKIF